MIYILIFLLCVFFVLVEQVKGSERIRPFLEGGMILFLILFVGFRYRIGPDYDSYEWIFFDPNKQKDMEPFFHFLFSAFNYLNSSYNLFLLFIAALSIGIKSYSIKHHSPCFFLSVLIALPVTFLADMGQIRFSLAMATLWLAIPFCIDRNLVKFILICFLAASMHYSSLIFLPMYWLGTKKINFWVILGSWTILYMVSYTVIASYFSDFISGLGIREFSAKLDLYGDLESSGGRYGVSLFGLISKLLVLILVYYSSIENETLKRFFINTYFMGGCFFFFFSFSEILGTRFSLYFFSFEALMVPVAIYTLKDAKLYYLLIFVFIVKALYQYTTQVYNSYQDMYLPYRNFLQNL